MKLVSHGTLFTILYYQGKLFILQVVVWVTAVRQSVHQRVLPTPPLRHF
jgi:hypothetical protein